MRKRTSSARKPKGPLQQMLDREALEEATAPIVNRFAAGKGDYERNLRFVTNRTSSTVTRWCRDKSLSDSQIAAIEHCQRLWARLGSQCLVIDFNRVRGQQHGDGYSQHEALAELHRIKSGFPLPYWDVFENVCRFDLPAGVAGSELANRKRSAEIAARMIVSLLADMIAMRERLSF